MVEERGVAATYNRSDLREYFLTNWNADSDEVARVKRDEAARDSWMMSPAVTE
jgi:hypothetical protein